ncbi:MFS transporter [Priestia endophytica]|jgi:MFS transporter, DHA2 family, metal-tetracycline-proton antiporter|uniref:MFS transporter n=1 Tax=Priestia endophytica TaxID=135735 RepID=UPI002E22062C|nr:MFS transporter [Priestia endophytica]MED4071047.1 MFS transporter [Priestia endophytica]
MIKDVKKTIVLLFILSFFNPMGGTLVIPALPFIAKDFHLNSSQSSWVFIGYEVMLIVGSVVYGRLAQAFKLRTLLYGCILLTMIGGLLALVSSNLLLLILARVIQGIALGAPIPLSMLIINEYFPKEKRKKGLTYIALAIALGTGLSPIIGGVTTSLFGWKSTFIVIASMIILLPFVKYIPDNKVEKRKIPYLAISLLAFSFLFLLYGIHGHILFLGISTLTWIIFVVINNTQNSLINFKTLKNKIVITVCTLNFLLMLTINSLFFLTPIYLEDLNHLSSIEIGLTLFPGAILSVLSMKLIEVFSSKFGSVTFLNVSIITLFIGLFVLLLSIGHSVLYTSVSFLFIYVGFAAVQSELSNFISVHLSQSLMSEGIGMSNLFFFMGATFGPALTGIFLDEKLTISNKIITFSTYHIGIIGMDLMVLVMFFIVILVMRRKKDKRQSNIHYHV